MHEFSEVNQLRTQCTILESQVIGDTQVVPCILLTILV